MKNALVIDTRNTHIVNCITRLVAVAILINDTIRTGQEDFASGISEEVIAKAMVACLGDLGLSVVLQVGVADDGPIVALDVDIDSGRDVGIGQDGCTQSGDGYNLHGRWLEEEEEGGEPK